MFFWFMPFVEAGRSAHSGIVKISTQTLARPRSYSNSSARAGSQASGESAPAILAAHAVAQLRKGIVTVASSLTALGNQMNAFFSQIVATLAFERVTRDYTAAMGFGRRGPAGGLGQVPLLSMGWGWPHIQPPVAAPSVLFWQPFAMFAQASAQLMMPRPRFAESPFQFWGGHFAQPRFI